MITLEDVAKKVTEELKKDPNALEGFGDNPLRGFTLHHFGDDAYRLIQEIDHMRAMKQIQIFDRLPKEIRHRISEFAYPLDMEELYDQCHTGPMRLKHVDYKALLDRMESAALAAFRLIVLKSFEGAGTNLKLVKKPETYAEAIAAKQAAAKEAVRRQNASRANEAGSISSPAPRRGSVSIHARD